MPVAYVAEELLTAPELDTDEPQSWLEVRGLITILLFMKLLS